MAYIAQVSNVSSLATLDQMKKLFGYMGKIKDIRMYPTMALVQPEFKVCYIKYSDTVSVRIALHLTNTVFIDRALVVVAIPGDNIPSEDNTSFDLLNHSSALPGLLSSNFKDVSNDIAAVDGTLVITSIDSNLDILGLPQYPPLSADNDPNTIEEIRRTIYIENISANVTASQLLDFINGVVGEVKYLRMAGQETDITQSAFVEFTDRASIVKALQCDGITLKGNKLKIQHSSTAIVKPAKETEVISEKDTEEAMKRLKEAESLIARVVEPEIRGTSRSHRRSSSRSRKRSRSSKRDRRSHSRDHRSRSKRRRSTSRRRKSRSRSKGRSRRSRRSRSRSKKRRSISRSRLSRSTSKSRRIKRRERSRSRRSRSKSKLDKSRRSGSRSRRSLSRRRSRSRSGTSSRKKTARSRSGSRKRSDRSLSRSKSSRSKRRSRSHDSKRSKRSSSRSKHSSTKRDIRSRSRSKATDGKIKKTENVQETEGGAKKTSSSRSRSPQVLGENSIQLKEETNEREVNLAPDQSADGMSNFSPAFGNRLESMEMDDIFKLVTAASTNVLETGSDFKEVDDSSKINSDDQNEDKTEECLNIKVIPKPGRSSRSHSKSKKKSRSRSRSKSKKRRSHSRSPIRRKKVKSRSRSRSRSKLSSRSDRKSSSKRDSPRTRRRSISPRRKSRRRSGSRSDRSSSPDYRSRKSGSIRRRSRSPRKSSSRHSSKRSLTPVGSKYKNRSDMRFPRKKSRSPTVEKRSKSRSPVLSGKGESDLDSRAHKKKIGYDSDKASDSE